MITGLNHITLAVKDVEESFAFYKEVLGLRPLCKWDKGAYFLPGDFWFCLNLDERREPNPCYTHYAFSVSPLDFQVMREQILRAGTPEFKDNTSPGESLYFLDPDGHKLEIHASDWQTRMAHKLKDSGSWQNVVWYNRANSETRPSFKDFLLNSGPIFEGLDLTRDKSPMRDFDLSEI